MKKLNLFIIAVVATAMLFTACKKEEAKVETPVTPVQKTIAGIASADTTFSILVAALNKAGLVATLNGTGNFTVFAPKNAVFRKYDITEKFINEMTDAKDIADLKDLLLYHVLGSEVKAAQLTNAYVPTLFLVGTNGVSLQVNIAPVKLNAEVNVTTADVDASNGVIHIIDDLLFPPTVVDIAINNPLFTSLVAAVTKADLVETLDNTNNLTVFAPVNQAFTDINFDLDSTSKEALTPILTAHVLGAQVRSSQITNGQKATTLNTAVELTFNTSSGVKLSGGKTTDASVVAADIQATNGVVHVINKVIIP
jgi:transforming growth factor-beta-induced protein